MEQEVLGAEMQNYQSEVAELSLEEWKLKR